MSCENWPGDGAAGCSMHFKVLAGSSGKYDDCLVYNQFNGRLLENATKANNSHLARVIIQGNRETFLS